MYIAWDIGIKNLSYCLMDKDNSIIEWDIIDLTGKDKCQFKCCGLKKNGDKCTSTSSVINKNNPSLTYCKLHSKHMTDELIPVYRCFKCKCDAKKRNKETGHFFCLRHLDKKIDESLYDTILVKNIAKAPLQLLGTLLISKLDERPSILKATKIVLENQPVLKNPTMKSIQIILYSYYLIKKKGSYTINMISAKNKLKFNISSEKIIEIKKIKNKYMQNKKLAIEYCSFFLNKEIDLKWKTYFENFPNKKDDLADSYLLNRYSILKG